MRRAIMLLATLLAGCGGSTPTAPTSPGAPVTPAPATPSTYTIGGTVTATNGGQPLAGVTVDVNGTTATTDGSGRYRLALSATGRVPMTIRGGALLAHRLFVTGSAQTVDADAIVQDGTFDPSFYQQLVRGMLDYPSQPLRRWTQPPAVYVMTIDDAGGPVSAAAVELVAAAIINTTPLWTGSFGVASLDRGTTPPAGTLAVRWAHSDTGSCGTTIVGGSILLAPASGPNCVCNGIIRPRTVKHELGHALGFYHTDGPADLMSAAGGIGCDADPSPRERYHAAIAYHRPVGNTDPDQDPPSTVN